MVWKSKILDQLFFDVTESYNELLLTGTISGKQKKTLLGYRKVGLWYGAYHYYSLSNNNKDYHSFQTYQTFHILNKYIHHGLADQEICDHHIKMFALDINIYDYRNKYIYENDSCNYKEVLAEFKSRLDMDLFTYFEVDPKKYIFKLINYIDFEKALDIMYQFIGLDKIYLKLKEPNKINNIKFPPNDLMTIYLRFREATADPYKAPFNDKQLDFLDNIYKTYGHRDENSNEYILHGLFNEKETALWLFLLADKNKSVVNTRTYGYFLQPRQIKIPKTFKDHHPFSTLEKKIKKSSLVNNNSCSFDRFSLFLWELKEKIEPNRIVPNNRKRFYITILNELNNITETVFDKDYFNPSYFNDPVDTQSFDKTKSKRNKRDDPWQRWNDSRKDSKKRI